MARANKMSEYSTQRLSELLEEAIQKKESDFVAPQELHRVKIQSQIDAKIKVTGEYSGQEYLFERAGSVQDVDERDVEWLLSRRQGERQCCGGTEKGNAMFRLAEN